ncbi:hypothetical protein [Paracoccus sp. (in: a-proteobacteria)]|uniref:hypothetical protein n=1 Tax=Paracoccus sp. TaxID=267 RepID=UPI0028979AA0|nr:hypothetical protein [Paracoccus sp. (in: a-proteobacteria)]
MTAPARYGNRRVPKMLAEINALRRVIAAEGTPNIQDAWDKVEEHIDFAYGRVAQGTTRGGSPDSDG